MHQWKAGKEPPPARQFFSVSGHLKLHSIMVPLSVRYLDFYPSILCVLHSSHKPVTAVHAPVESSFRDWFCILCSHVEVLEEIPTAPLAITGLRVTSYTKKVMSGRCGKWRGGGECKTHVRRKERKRRRVNAQRFVTGYHGLISHEHLLEERV